MNATHAIEAALRALAGSPEAAAQSAGLDELRRPLAEGERALFAHALKLRQESPASPLAGERAAAASAQAGRLADLLARHAALLRTQPSDEAPCPLAAVVAEACSYFGRLPPGVRRVVDLPPRLPRVLARK